MNEQQNDSNHPRMSVRGMLDECVDVLLLEKGFLYTTKELLLRPGQTIRRVLNGERSQLNPPLRFMFVSVTLIAIAMNLTSDAIYVDIPEPPILEESQAKIDAVSQTLEKYQADPESDFELRFRSSKALEGIQKSTTQQVMELLYSWNNVVLTLAVPIFAIGTICFFRRGYNFAEHLAINAYIHGAQCLLALLSIPIGMMGWAMTSSVFYLAVSIAYQLWAWAHIFQFRSIRAWLFAPVLILISLAVYILMGLALMTLVMAYTFQTSIPVN